MINKGLGVRKNLSQFLIYSVITFLIGSVMGIERVAVPPLAKDGFHITSIVYAVSFLSAFGAVKAVMNLVSGRLSDHHGRRSLLILGWLFAVPFALLVIFAKSWLWVVLANLFLGVNQGLTWSMSVTAKIDLVGPKGRGFAVGIDESAGYLGVGAGSFLAGVVVTRFGLRPAPYVVILGIFLASMVLSTFFARETKTWATMEASQLNGVDEVYPPKLSKLASYMSFRDREMAAICNAGFINKFIDTLMIAFIPIYLIRSHVTIFHIALAVSLYAWIWGLGQAFTGHLADKIGRKTPIVFGTFLISLSIGSIAAFRSYQSLIVSSSIMGLGMALVYPNLISAVGDVAHPTWRGGALGVFRLWRDGGYALAPLALGAISALLGDKASIYIGAVLAFLSAVTLFFLYHETEPSKRKLPFMWQVHPEWVKPRSRAT